MYEPGIHIIFSMHNCKSEKTHWTELGIEEKLEKAPSVNQWQKWSAFIMDFLLRFWNTLRSESSNKNFRSSFKVDVEG